MRNKKIVVAIVTLVSVGLVAIGCETMGESAALGGVVGAGAGAIIGNQAGHHGVEGAIIGGLAGALAGVIIHDVKAQQKRDAQATAAQYKYTPDQGTRVLGETGAVSPTVVKPGGTVRTSVQYAVLGAGPGGITVKETRTLKQNGQVIKQVSSQDFMRTDGTWESTQEISFPANTPPGAYEVAQTVSAGNAQFQQNVGFNVQP